MLIRALLGLTLLGIIVGCGHSDELTTPDPLVNPLEAYDSCTISVLYEGIDNEGSTLPTAGMYFDNYGGQWEGNTFTMAWDVTDHGGAYYQGAVSLTIDPLTQLITRFSASSTSMYTSDGPLAIFEIVGGELTIEESDEDSHFYTISGENMCATVSHLYHREEVDGTVTEEFLDFDCNDQSYVNLFIWDMN